MNVRTITPQELCQLQRCGEVIELIDVRTPAEYEGLRSEPAKLMPLDKLDPAAVMASRNGSTQSPLYIICRSGSRGQRACTKFEAAGFANVVNVAGGTLAWEPRRLGRVWVGWAIPL